MVMPQSRMHSRPSLVRSRLPGCGLRCNECGEGNKEQREEMMEKEENRKLVRKRYHEHKTKVVEEKEICK